MNDLDEHFWNNDDNISEWYDIKPVELRKLIIKASQVLVFVSFNGGGHYFQTTKKSAMEFTQEIDSVDGCVTFNKETKVLEIG